MAIDDPSIQSAKAMARLSGFSYLMYTSFGAYITFGPVPVTRVFADPATAPAGAELLLRTGIVAETVLYVFVAIAAAAMYAALKPVSPGLAIVGGFCRLVEAALGAVFIVVKYAAFQALVHPGFGEVFTAEERLGVNRLLVSVAGSGFFVLLIFMGVGAAILFALFFRARFIPRWLAAWGVLTYLVMIALSASILIHPPIQDFVMVFFLPGSLFELVAGLWLLFAGINTEHWTRQR
ncbi:MAG: DUF4386 domain-containing protein [Pseudomonadota bacterium]